MEVSEIKQIVIILLLAGLVLALITLAFRDTFANFGFGVPTAFTKISPFSG